MLSLLCSMWKYESRQTPRPFGQPQVFGVFPQTCQCHCRVVFSRCKLIVKRQHEHCNATLCENYDNTLDFHQSGAKVWRNNEISKDADGAGQNLICNALSISTFPLSVVPQCCSSARATLACENIDLHCLH